MQQTIASSPDLLTVITNLGIFSLAVAAAVGGIWKGIKSVKREDDDSPQRIAQATIMESTTMLMLSESNRSLEKEVVELRHAINRLIEKLDE